MKQLSINISCCKDCPFFGLEPFTSYENYNCKYRVAPGAQRMRMEKEFNPCKDIPSWCPLEDLEECENCIDDEDNPSDGECYGCIRHSDGQYDSWRPKKETQDPSARSVEGGGE